MSDPSYFVGFWKVLKCTPETISIDLKGMKGTTFQLCRTGDVTWEIPENAVSIPLFKCDTYMVVSITSDRTCFDLRFGTYKGHVIKCSVKVFELYKGVFCMSDGWCQFVCKKFKDISEEDAYEVPFSFLPALQESYFSDLKLRGRNNKEFNVHTCILKLSAPEIDWSKKNLFSNLPEDVLFAILYFCYAQCLPAGLNESTVKNIISAASELPGLGNLVSTCYIHLKNKALKNQILTLVSEIHGCATQIIEYFTNRHPNDSSGTLDSDPARLCFAVKNSVREAAVAASKLLMMCDLYNKCKNEFSREERQEIILHARSRIPFFMNQLESFLQAVKTTFDNLLPFQRQELACYLVPEVETILNTIASLLLKIKTVLEIMLKESEMEEEKNSEKVMGTLEEFADSALCKKEKNRRQCVFQRISSILVYLVQKKELFNLMTSRNKIRSVAKKLEELMEELPIIVLKVEEFKNTIEEKLQWSESQFCFKVGSSKVSEIIKKLVIHKESLQDVLTELCDLVQRDSFSQTFVALGLLESSINTASSAQEIQSDECGRITPDKDLQRFDLKQSTCVPPPAHRNELSEAAFELLRSGAGTDMTFEIIIPDESTGSVDQLEDESKELFKESLQQVENCEVAAHRVIVASRCDWFRKALLSGMQEDINRKIQVHDTNPQIFSLFLKYLYSGQLEFSSLSVDQISELLLLSDRYELDPLKQICEYGLYRHVDGDSVLYFYSMADRFNAKILKSACEEFIAQHPEVIDSETFEELPENLQSEVYDVVICGKPQAINLPPLDEFLSNPSPEATDIEEMLAHFHLDSNLPSPESDSSSLSGDFCRLEEALARLREIVGERASRSQLVQVILAADYDVNRALNFYYSST